MKPNNIVMLLVWAIFLISGITFAQQEKTTDTLPIPKSVKENCLLTQSGTIDFCPNYWNQLNTLNTKLSQERSTLESEGVITLLDTINSKLKNLNSKSNALIMKSLAGYPLFIAEYEQYITTLLHTYIKDNSEKSNIVWSFFETTYFNQDQSGLWIKEVKIYKWIPQQYDKWLLLQVSIRNYTTNPISNIEDLYCFSTINDQDYIYPMNIKTSFKENSITNLIVELKPDTSPLLENSGEKNIACTLVYSQFGQTKYTNRGKLSFMMKQE